MENKVKSGKFKKVLYYAAVIICIMLMAAVCAAEFYLDHGNKRLYLAGCIWRKNTLVTSMPTVGLFGVFLAHLPSLKSAADEKARKKLVTWLWVAGIWCVLSAAFIAYDCIDTFRQSKEDVMVGVDFDDDKGFLIVEREEEYSSGKTYYDINVYRRERFTVKFADRIFEDQFTNEPMLKNGLYEIETSGDTLTLRLDYGELSEGYEWAKEEYKENPPEYIEKVYEFESSQER